jgi:hypothetical protein
MLSCNLVNFFRSSHSCSNLGFRGHHAIYIRSSCSCGFVSLQTPEEQKCNLPSPITPITLSRTRYAKTLVASKGLKSREMRYLQFQVADPQYSLVVTTLIVEAALT